MVTVAQVATDCCIRSRASPPSRPLPWYQTVPDPRQVSWLVCVLPCRSSCKPEAVKNPHENHSRHSGDFSKLLKEGFVLFLFSLECSVAGAYRNVPFAGLPPSRDDKLLAGLLSGLFPFHLRSAHSDDYSVGLPSTILFPCLLLELVQHSPQALPPRSCPLSDVKAL